MIKREACPAAEVNLTSVANVRGAYSLLGLAAALHAVSVLANEFRIVIFGERMSRVGTCTRSLWPLLEWELLHQFAHELLTEPEVSRAGLADGPECEGIDDAHVEQPPCQARPRSSRLPADGV